MKKICTGYIRNAVTFVLTLAVSLSLTPQIAGTRYMASEAEAQTAYSSLTDEQADEKVNEDLAVETSDNESEQTDVKDVKRVSDKAEGETVSIPGTPSTETPAIESESESESETETETEAPKQPVSMKITAVPGADNIVLTWDKVSDAARYTVYYSADGSNYSVLSETTGAGSITYTHTGLSAVTTYSYYVEAFDSNGNAVGRSERESFTTLKITTTVSGATKGFSRKARTTATDTIVVNGPAGRVLKVQMYDTSKKKWATKKKIQLGSNASQEVKVTYPKTWWYSSKSTWRYYIPASASATKYVSDKITVKTKRYYQNPKKYVQIKSSISKHGKNYYTYPVKTKLYYTRSQYVNTMINAAKKYLGDPYVVGRSGQPGRGVDCSGLVMQACYAAGVDLWPSNPYRHQFPKYEYESRYIANNKKLKTVSWKNRKKGDLIFYQKGGIIIHVAIYMGNGKIIHSWPGQVQISSATNPRWGSICKLKRIFV